MHIFLYYVLLFFFGFLLTFPSTELFSFYLGMHFRTSYKLFHQLLRVLLDLISQFIFYGISRFYMNNFEQLFHFWYYYQSPGLL